jgi:hypothetical protein
MQESLESYYLQKEEPIRSCLLALRDIILSQDKNITNNWKYRMPFFCYKGKMFCYLWTDKKTKEPYIGIVEGNRLQHSFLEKGNRSRMKIFRIDSKKDLPIELIENLVNELLDFYRKGIIKI